MTREMIAAEDITLLLILTILFNFFAGAITAPALVMSRPVIFDTIWMIWLVHAAGSIYCGGFWQRRAAFWCFLVTIPSILIVTGFLDYVLPWGQIGLWLATKLTDIFPSHADFFAHFAWPPPAFVASVVPVLSAIFALSLIIDIGFAHGRRLRQRSLPKNLTLLCGAVFLGIVIGIAAMVLAPVPEQPFQPDTDLVTPAYILPSWRDLPFYSMVRGAPAPLAGLVLYMSAMPMLVAVPGLRGEIWRGSRFWPLWSLLCFALYGTWLGLTWLGAQPPEDAIIDWSFALSLWYFTFFLLMPFMARVARKNVLAKR